VDRPDPGPPGDVTRGDPVGPLCGGPSFDAGATAYDRFMGRCSRLFVPALLDAAGIRPGARVLDVAVGTGEAALEALRRVGSSGCVIGVDLSLPMMRVAAARAAGRRLRLLAMDGQWLGWRDASFDAVLCQLGLMFFPDPGRGLAEFRRVLRPGGVVGATVWSTIDRMPLAGVLCTALERRLPAQRDTLRLTYSLADADRLAAALERAGLREASVTPTTRRVVFESVDEYVGAFEAGAGRYGQLYLGLPEEDRRAVLRDLRSALARFERAGRLVFDVEGLLAVARA
jgi:ubiquinone/menaquinone biosynthesis C-methylase UbiE